MERPNIAIVIPAWNEERTIADVVKQVIRYGKVIVVDDASTDDTAAKAERAGAIVVSHKKNMGYDEALNSGFEKAYEEGCKYVITFDADGQHNHEIIDTYIEQLVEKGIPLVIGKRPNKARFAEVIIGFYAYWRFNVNDILCGMKGYNMELWLRNGRFDHVKSIGSELGMASIKRGYKFVEVDVPISPRSGEARFGNRLKGNLRIIKGLLGLIWLDLTGLKGESA